MIELATSRKNKIVLADYNYKHDIENRLLLSQFTSSDYGVLEEILFSPIRTPLRKIAKSTDLPEDELLPILQKLAKTGLISFEDDTIVVDKEMRKYFEIEMARFEEDFQPGMEFLQHLLKKVPIHVLPHWYSIPRTSNNIFASLIEKYLLTPQIFQRYLLEITFPDPILSAIAQDILKAPRFELTAEEVQKKYHLSPRQFQEAVLSLEFHFICTVVYRKKDQWWIETLTLFQEWKEHLSFLKATTPTPIAEVKKIERYRPTDFSFVEDMTSVLLHAKKQPSFLEQKSDLLKLAFPAPDELYLKRLLLKIEQVGLARLENRKFSLTPAGLEWLDLRSENKALYLYRHPSNHPQACLPASLLNEKVIREAEKSILRVLYSGWVLFSDFIQGVYIPLSDGQNIALRKIGKNWKYQRPLYSPSEIALIQAVVLEHLFEVGITAIGSFKGDPCFCVTSFGQSFFG